MKPVKIENPDNVYQLSDEEVSIIHAMAFYILPDDNLTPKARKLIQKIEEQFRMHPAKGSIKVWND